MSRESVLRLSLALPLIASCAWSHGREDAGDAAPRDAGVVTAVDVWVPPPVDAGPIELGDPCRAEPAPPPSPPAVGCDVALCGNGARDTCTMCGPCWGPGPPRDVDAGACCSNDVEACDGQDLGGASCESIGYSGGVLSCGDWCGLDASACDVCESAPEIAACGRAEVDPAQPGWMALATRGEEIGVAWSTSPALDGSSALHFARFSADLELIAEPGCIGSHDAHEVALAATPSGWIVAATTGAGIEVAVLDPSGAVRTVRTIAGGAVPILAGRSDGGPLLTYVDMSSRSTLHASLLSEDGAPAWDAPLVDAVIEAEYGSAVSTGDGFLVAARGFDGVVVMRVELDSSVGAPHAFAGSDTEYPQLAWSGTRGHLSWADFAATPTLRSVALDHDGAALGAPVQLGSAPSDYNPAPLIATGDDTIALMPGYTGWTAHGQHVGVVRLDPSGAPRGDAVTVARDPSFMHQARIAALGDGAVLAWLSAGYPGGVYLARVSP